MCIPLSLVPSISIPSSFPPPPPLLSRWKHEKARSKQAPAAAAGWRSSCFLERPAWPVSRLVVEVAVSTPRLILVVLFYFIIWSIIASESFLWSLLQFPKKTWSFTSMQGCIYLHPTFVVTQRNEARMDEIKLWNLVHFQTTFSYFFWGGESY